MKILLLSDPSSIHTIRWANALSTLGIEIFVFGFTNFNPNLYQKGIQVDFINTPKGIITKEDIFFQKAIYLTSLFKLKKIIKVFKPEIIHSHYATSYGLIGALLKFHPFIISVWGTDVFSFPRKSIIHKTIFKYNLSKADKVLSTSKVMKKEIQKYYSGEIEITPFGIDIEKFKPKLVNRLFNKEDIVIGTVKALEKNYGIEYLIKAFYRLLKKYSSISLKLLIVGEGSNIQNLIKISEELNILDRIIFTGRIEHNDIPKYHNMIDIAVYLSIEESFGVSVLESSACGKPVVVSNVGGLPEIVVNKMTGIVVEPKDVLGAAKAIEKLILDKELRIKIGENGRERVTKFYNWEKNLEQMVRIYNDIKNLN